MKMAATEPTLDIVIVLELLSLSFIIVLTFICYLFVEVKIFSSHAY